MKLPAELNKLKYPNVKKSFFYKLYISSNNNTPTRLVVGSKISYDNLNSICTENRLTAVFSPVGPECVDGLHI